MKIVAFNFDAQRGKKSAIAPGSVVQNKVSQDGGPQDVVCEDKFVSSMVEAQPLEYFVRSVSQQSAMIARSCMAQAGIAEGCGVEQRASQSWQGCRTRLVLKQLHVCKMLILPETACCIRRKLLPEEAESCWPNSFCWLPLMSTLIHLWNRLWLFHLVFHCRLLLQSHQPTRSWLWLRKL